MGQVAGCVSGGIEHGGNSRLAVLQTPGRTWQLRQRFVMSGTGLLHTRSTDERLIDLTVENEIDAQPAPLTEVIGQRRNADGFLHRDRTVDETQRLFVSAA